MDREYLGVADEDANHPNPYMFAGGSAWGCICYAAGARRQNAAFFAAVIVLSMSFFVCRVLTKHASNCEGGR